MEIKKFNDMKAYLLKPNRLFSSNNSRNNFAYGSIPGKGNSKINYDPETQIYRKRVQETIDGKKTGKYIYSEPGQSLEDFKQTKAVRSTGAIDATVKARQYIDGWTKNWFDNNLKNYGVKDFEVMLNDLSNDWNEVLESTDAPKASAQFKLSTPELNLPNITSKRDVKMKKGSIEPFTYNDVRFYSNLEGSKDQLSKTLSQYKKVFYKNKIETDPQLRTGLNEFFDFMSADKRGLYKKLDGKTIKDFMNTVSDDVKFLLDAEISGLDKASKNKVFNAYDDLADNYNKFTQDKVRLKAVQAETEAIAKVGEKTADQYKKVKETIKKQNDVLAKMSVEDIAKNKNLLNSVRMVINPKTGEVSYTNYTVNDPKGKPVLTDLELAEKIKQKAKNKNFFVTEHIGKKSLNKMNLAFPNNIQSANYMSNAQLENARRFLINPENRNTPAAQNLDKALEQTGLTIRGSEYGGQRFGNKIDIEVPASTGRSTLVDSQLIDTKKTGSSQIDDLLKIEGVKRASEIDRPESAVTRDMFTGFNERIANAKNIPLNEVEQDVSNVSKVLNEMSSKMSSGVDPKDIIKYVGAEAKDLVEFGKKYGGDALGKIGKTVIGLDLPIMQVAFASMQDWEEDSPLWVTLPAAFTDEVANAFNLYNKTGGKTKEFGKYLASSFIPRAARSPLFKAVSKVGKGASLAAPLLELGQEAYKFEKQKRMLPEIARQFDIPIEAARKGFQNYIRSTIPQDPAAQGMDELSVPESPGLPRLKRTFQDIGSLFGFGESPYKDPNAKEESAILPKAKPSLTERGFVAEGGRMGFKGGTEVPVVTVKDKIDELISFYQDYLKQGGKMNFMTFAKKYIPENFSTGGRVGFSVGGIASLFRKAAEVSDSLRSVKNSVFDMWNNVRMFGEQEGVAKNLTGFTNIPDKNRKTSSLQELQTLKTRVPEKYHQDLNIMIKSIEQNNFETAWKEYQKFEKELDPTLKFENIPQEYFPMLDPLNDSFVIKGPSDDFKVSRYRIRTSMDLDPKTKEPTGKYQTEKYDTFDPETRTFRKEPVLVGADTEKGKKGFN